MPRTIAIGDIHGCSHELASLLSAIAPQPDDTIIPLGDYVDRGHDSKGVLDLLLDLSSRCRVVPVLGSHDEMMLRSKDCRPVSSPPLLFEQLKSLEPENAHKPSRKADRQIIGMQRREVKQVLQERNIERKAEE